MKFDKILQYQKIDLEANALKAEMSKSDAYLKYQDSQAKLEAATANIGKLTAEANDLLRGYDAMKSKIETLTGELAEFDGILDGVEDIKEAEHYLKLVSAISDRLTALEKEAAAVASKIEQISSAYSKTWAQGVKATQANKAAKAEYNAFAADFKGKFDEIQQKLNALVKEIPEDVLNEYLTLKKSKKLPVYVEFDAEHKVCGRCRMEVPNDVCSKLKAAGDYAECPNCRRIMYVPENQ
ncbi:MAG: C4-type zinc ribbon domain-containing protein [Bacteroides sp.]|nr:C4-type zinc ribbon domain-containing protein [Bacillota bacterium]MCM1394189.1 C4-type zinc ribbon domain-containing protein [[Eubacterium] siraeum]MCM1455943.1 C4-type zinc ribbon domain-containing protein [Bacteroides sp.]